jgi:transcriptional regulator with XRE-family HTH domain
MNNIGNIISEARKNKGLTQEELSVLANVNLRTIQRIENNINDPRSKTLTLVCSILELNYENLINTSDKKKSYQLLSIVMNGLFLLLINFGLMVLFGYLTLDSNASLNSRVAGALLGVLLPFFIVWSTSQMTGLERVFKFGSGFIIYIALVLIKLGVKAGLFSGLFICLILALAVLFYGNKLIELRK